MATTAARGAGTSRATEWSPARVYLVATGIFLIVAAAVGFSLTTSFPQDAEAVHSAGSAHIFGIFETNGWHNLSTLISGTISLAFALRPGWARTGAFAKAALYATVTVSIAIWGPEPFLIVSNAADQIVHGSLAVAGFGAALATPRASINNMD